MLLGVWVEPYGYPYGIYFAIFCRTAAGPETNENNG